MKPTQEQIIAWARKSHMQSHHAREEVEKIYLESFDEGQFAHAIEAKLKEKNT